jgi:hypothetical protein
VNAPPPVIERAVSCRYPVIEPERFTDARKRWQTDGSLKLAEVFQLPPFFPIKGGDFVPPLQQTYTWCPKADTRIRFSVQLLFPPVQKEQQLLAHLMTTASLLFAEGDLFDSEIFQKTLHMLHHMHTDSFQEMLTPAMLAHCGIAQSSAGEATK